MIVQNEKLEQKQEKKIEKVRKERLGRKLLDKIAGWPAVRSHNFDIDG